MLHKLPVTGKAEASMSLLVKPPESQTVCQLCTGYHDWAHNEISFGPRSELEVSSLATMPEQQVQNIIQSCVVIQTCVDCTRLVVIATIMFMCDVMMTDQLQSPRPNQCRNLGTVLVKRRQCKLLLHGFVKSFPKKLRLTMTRNSSSRAHCHTIGCSAVHLHFSKLA